MDITILVDSTLDQFKAVEAIIRNIYKNSTFQIHVGGIRIPGNYSVPEGTTMDRTIEFRSGTTDKKEMKVVFSIDVQIEYPIFKTKDNGFGNNKSGKSGGFAGSAGGFGSAGDTEMFNGNRMVRLSVYNTWGGQGASGQSIVGPTGLEYTSSVFIDPTSTSTQGPSLHLNVNDTGNLREGDPIPNEDPWPLATGSTALPPHNE